uniref:GABA receptor alpha-like protein n=1 Tax=Homarus americanus TaxID=6706 RepID=A0A1J0FAU0_HOMAM|nr:GABA receptor alpha-like protein [Homarus americanus]
MNRGRKREVTHFYFYRSHSEVKMVSLRGVASSSTTSSSFIQLPTGALLLFLLLSFRVASSEVRSPHRSFPRIHRNLPNFSFRSGEVRQITPSKNISKLLDNLLEGYDQTLRPSFGGDPTTVEIDIEVRSMSQISEMDMTYSMDCYFRQSWVDERLAFSDLEEAFTLSVSVLDKLWKPDTFIYNGKKSYVHLITTPNKFIRLYQNGRILYSSRLTINANCPMNLHDFPMDTQRCPLKLGSFAYTTQDVIYRWNENRQVVIASDLMLSQFDLIATPSGFENTTRRAGEFSTLLASFHLQRHMGNFMITVYGPCVLLVVLSWVSFWLNREATSDRISLGITTVLTMTFLGLEARTDLPKVPYSTALDLFVWLSYGFIFATIIEFAFVHVFTKVGSGEVYLSEASSEFDSDEEEEEDDEEPDTEPVAVCMTVTQRGLAGSPSTGPNGVGTSKPRASLTMGSKSSFFTRLARLCGRGGKGSTPATPVNTIDHLKKARRAEQRRQQAVAAAVAAVVKEEEEEEEARRWNQGRRSKKTTTTTTTTTTTNKLLQMNSVSNIDEISRVLFPLSFLCINFLYWYTFLSYNPWPQNYL